MHPSLLPRSSVLGTPAALTLRHGGLALSAIALLSLFEPTAWAQDAHPKVAVVGLHEAGLSAADEDRITADLAAAVEATGRFDAVTGAEISAAIAGREEVVVTEGLLGEGRRLLAEGRNSYNQAQPDQAIPVLEQAIVALERNVSATNTTRDLWDAFVYLGTAHYSLVNLDDPNDPHRPASEQAYRNAAALNVNRLPDATAFPPDVIEAYNTQRGLVGGQGQQLQVSVARPEASVGDTDVRIWLDGELVGPAPAMVDNVLPGQHFLVARGKTSAAFQQLDVAPGSAAAMTLTLGDPSLGSAPETVTARTRQTADLYRALGGRASGIDYILLAGVEGGMLRLQLYSAAKDAFSTAAELPYTDTAADEAIAGIPGLLSRVGPDGRLDEAQVQSTAIPLDVGANLELARLLLLSPKSGGGSVAGGGGGDKGGGGKGLVVGLGIGGGLVALAGGGTAVYLLTRGDGGGTTPTNEPPALTGTIVVGPFRLQQAATVGLTIPLGPR